MFVVCPEAQRDYFRFAEYVEKRALLEQLDSHEQEQHPLYGATLVAGFRLLNEEGGDE